MVGGARAAGQRMGARGDVTMGQGCSRREGTLGQNLARCPRTTLEME